MGCGVMYHVKAVKNGVLCMKRMAEERQSKIRSKKEKTQKHAVIRYIGQSTELIEMID